MCLKKGVTNKTQADCVAEFQKDPETGGMIGSGLNMEGFMKNFHKSTPILTQPGDYLSPTPT